MALLSYFLLACSSASIFTSACAPAPQAAVNAPVSYAASTSGSMELAMLDQASDEALTLVRRLDTQSRTPDGKLATLPPAEHIRRAALYNTNRLFAQAREHWQALIDRYPQDANVPAALFGIGRAFYQERRFAEALPYFERAGQNYSTTKEGRDAFYYVAPTLLRLNRAPEAAVRYVGYIERFPQGERTENAYLNAIDTFREAGNNTDARAWVDRTRERFRNTKIATDALFARLRLEVGASDWLRAITTADELLRTRIPSDSSTTTAEVAFLRAYSFERASNIAEAVRAYSAIPDDLNSYYGGRATERLMTLGATGRTAATRRQTSVRAAARSKSDDYPTPFRDDVLRAAQSRNVDPRFILAIMRQESGFRPNVKSPAAARGLMQMTVDTAAKYAAQVGLQTVTENDLYRPAISTLLAGEYIAELNKMFPATPEAVAASYNGGEDNAARWLRRAVHNEPGIFAAEVGYTETKDYVFKVSANYRAYRQLYASDLKPLK